MAPPRYILGSDLGSRIAVKIGLKPDGVQSMTLDITPDDVVRLNVVYLPDEADIEEIHQYILMEVQVDDSNPA